jgi:hypothetical protein
VSDNDELHEMMACPSCGQWAAMVAGECVHCGYRDCFDEIDEALNDGSHECKRESSFCDGPLETCPLSGEVRCFNHADLDDEEITYLESEECGL